MASVIVCCETVFTFSYCLHFLPFCRKFLSIYLSDQQNSTLQAAHPIQATAGTFAPGGTKFFCAYHNGAICVIDFLKNKYRVLVHLHRSVTALTVHPISEQLLVASSDYVIRILNRGSGKECGTLRGHTCSINSIFIQPRHGTFALTVGLSEAILWNLATFECRCRLRTEADSALTAAFFLNPSGDQVFTCFRDGSMYLWETSDLGCSNRLEKAPSTSSYLVFAQTSLGSYMFAAGRSSSIHLWHLNRQTSVQVAVSVANDQNRPFVLQEVIQLSWRISNIRRLAWIGESSLGTFLLPGENETDELDGLLVALGSDHRAYFLRRHRNSHMDTLHSKDGHNQAYLSPTLLVKWLCLFTIGSGSYDDPLIHNLIVPQPSVLGTSLSDPSKSPVPIGNAYLALIDLHGYAHIHDLSVCLRQLKRTNGHTCTRRRAASSLSPVNSSVPVLKVQNGYTALCDRSKHSSPAPTPNPIIKRPASSCVKSTPHSISEPSVYTDPTDGLLHRGRLRMLLKEFGRFPDKYRLFIWRAILKLPSNAQAFHALVKKGTHSAYENLPVRYPIRERKLLHALQRVCSALAFWCPLFGETDWLPMFAFPFIKLFQSHLLQAFEVVATILINWCSAWFEYFPSPPINVLCMIENLVAYNDQELYHHLVKCQVTTEIYAWPLLQTCLSESFTQEEWLQLWDTILCSSPGFLVAVVAAYTLCARGPLLRVHELDVFDNFFRGQNAVALVRLVDKAHQLMACCPPDMNPDRLIGSLLQPTLVDGTIDLAINNTSPSRKPLLQFQPLTSPDYPIVMRYPKFIVDFHARERERIREEEKEYLRQRSSVEDLERRVQMLAYEEQNWYRQQQILLDAEQRRRQMFAAEQAKLRDQRNKLDALIRKAKLRELTLTAESRNRLRQLELSRHKAAIDNMEEQLKIMSTKRMDEINDVTHAAELARLPENLQGRCSQNARFVPQSSEVSPTAPPTTTTAVETQRSSSPHRIIEGDDSSNLPTVVPELMTENQILAAEIDELLNRLQVPKGHSLSILGSGNNTGQLDGR
ncbi:unnamed protein product [Dicrocoelium dendriticum]|nr:unnamed protein product [Dicrocoelium dendriticum]